MRYFLFSFFFLSVLQAAPAGNVYQPSILMEGFFIPDTAFFNFRLGFQSDAMPEKKMHITNSPELHHCRLKWNTYSGSFTANIKERLDLYGSLGAGSARIRFDPGFLGKAHNGLIWNAGAKLVLLEIKNTIFGGDVKYLGGSFPMTFKNLSGVHRLKLNEWQIAVGLAQKIAFFIPYLGVTICNSKAKLRSPTLKLEQKKSTGVYFGLGISKGSYILANFEGRFVNERAFTATLELRF